MITQFKCRCGAHKPEDAKEYDGSLGYEAVICRKCGRYWDYEGEYEPDDWSRNYVGIKTPVVNKPKIPKTIAEEKKESGEYLLDADYWDEPY